jgi:uncharacterized membrane protein
VPTSSTLGTAEQLAAPLEAPRFQPARDSGIDCLRGLIMIVMAIDHASLFIAHRHSSESWNGEITVYHSVFPFLTRFVTHLCAPGFFFLMGMGMAMFTDSRRSRGWSENKIAWYMVKRGSLLLVVNQLIENPAWLLGTAFQADSLRPASGRDPAVLVFGVITALGLTMALGGILLRFGSTLWLVVSVGLLIATNAWAPGPAQSGELFSPLTRFALVPGRTGIMYVIYPVLPWFPLAGLGVVFGRWMRRPLGKALEAAPILGVGLIAAALTLRALGGFGNICLPRDASLVEFFNFVKYPPALVFSLFMLGSNLVLVALLSGRASRFNQILNVYGRAPLFFYLAHLYLFGLLGALFFRHPVSLQTMYLVWVIGLVPLYFACQRYRAFKESKSLDSIWRLF